MYQKEIKEYIKNHTVFFVKDFQKYIDITDDKKSMVNTELARFESKGIIKRLTKGFYAVPIKTCFGMSLPNKKLIAEKLYIEGYNGYTSGATFLNQIGLSTWMPKKVQIKSNRKERQYKLEGYDIDRPRTEITKDNILYFQLLDGIDDMDKYAIDNKEPDKIIYLYIKEQKLDLVKMLLIGKKYYKKPVIDKLYQILEEYYETT